MLLNAVQYTHRTVSTTKNYPAPEVSHATAEEPSYGGIPHNDENEQRHPATGMNVAENAGRHKRVCAV